MRARIVCPSWAKDCRSLRPASGSNSGASSTPVTWRITPDRARKPVQTQGLARVVTGRPVTTLARGGGAVEAQGERGKRFARNLTHALFAGSGSAGKERRRVHRRELEARENCRDGALFQLRRQLMLGAARGDADRCASRTRARSLSGDGLRRRQATRAAEGAASLMLHAPLCCRAW